MLESRLSGINLLIELIMCIEKNVLISIGLAVDEQALTCKGKTLQNDKKLAYYHLKEGRLYTS